MRAGDGGLPDPTRRGSIKIPLVVRSEPSHVGVVEGKNDELLVVELSRTWTEKNIVVARRDRTGQDGTDRTEGQDGTDGQDGPDGTDSSVTAHGTDGRPDRTGPDGTDGFLFFTRVRGDER